MRARFSRLWKNKDPKRTIQIEPDDRSAFSNMLALSLGLSVRVEGLSELLHLGKLADFYQIHFVVNIVEDTLIKNLTKDNFGWMLSQVHGTPLQLVEKRARYMILHDFDDLARTASFMTLDAEPLESLLDDNSVESATEENIFEAVVRWIEKRACGAVTAERLLTKIRYPCMAKQYLQTEARGRAADICAKVSALIQEAIDIKACTRRQLAVVRLSHLPRRSLVPRKGLPYKRHKLELDTEKRITATCTRFCSIGYSDSEGRIVLALESCEVGLVCLSTCQCQTLVRQPMQVPVTCMVSYGEYIICCCRDGAVRAWNMATGDRHSSLVPSAVPNGPLGEHEFKNGIRTLCVCGDWLLYGTCDGLLWRVLLKKEEIAWRWRLHGAVRAAEGEVRCIAGRDEWAATSGRDDAAIAVWDTVGWARAARLQGHAAPVTALAVAASTDGERRLISASKDGTLRVWSGGAGAGGAGLVWRCAQTVSTGGGGGAAAYIGCLAVGGPRLYGGRVFFERPRPGGWAPGAETGGGVVTWDLATLEVKGPVLDDDEDGSVTSLLCAGEYVWALTDTSSLVALPRSGPVRA